MVKKINKRGQIAIFVIIAVVIVTSILLFFFLRRAPVGVGEASFDPEQYIAQCVGPSISEVVDIILPQGGFLNPTNFKIYNDTKVSYLCKNSGYFEPCVNQHPMLINEINEEIKSFVSPVVENCFNSLKTELEKRQAMVELGETESIDVSMAPGKVFATIVKNVKITKKENVRTFDKVDIEIVNPIYDLTNIAIEIANNQAEYCYFEHNGYMLLYPKFDIRMGVMSDSTKIYSIKDKESSNIMNIAIRSCAMPPGMGI